MDYLSIWQLGCSGTRDDLVAWMCANLWALPWYFSHTAEKLIK